MGSDTVNRPLESALTGVEGDVRSLPGLDFGEGGTELESGALGRMITVLVKVMFCPPERVVVNVTKSVAAEIGEEENTGAGPGRLVVVTTTVVVGAPGKLLGTVVRKIKLEGDVGRDEVNEDTIVDVGMILGPVVRSPERTTVDAVKRLEVGGVLVSTELAGGDSIIALVNVLVTVVGSPPDTVLVNTRVVLNIVAVPEVLVFGGRGTITLESPLELDISSDTMPLVSRFGIVPLRVLVRIAAGFEATILVEYFDI